MPSVSRVLYITHTSPVPAKIGPSRRHFHILDQLLRFYDVALVSLGAEGSAERLAEQFGARLLSYSYSIRHRSRLPTIVRKTWRTLTHRCDFVPVLDPSFRMRVAELTSSQSFDLILLSTILLRGLPIHSMCPIVGDTHNVDCDVLARTAAVAESASRRIYAALQGPATFREERRSALNVDLVLTTSDRDRGIVESRLGAQKVRVIPNGVDIAEFATSAHPTRDNVVLFTGLMSYYPNQHGIRWFLNSVLPRVKRQVRNVRVVIAGAAPPSWLRALKGPDIEVTGAVHDMRPYLERANLVIVPLFIGGGTRVKILEAQAARRAVVSTSIGAEGLNVTDGESILIADDAEAFAECVVRLLEDELLVERICSEALRRVVDRYDWNHIGNLLEFTLRETFGLSSRQAAQTCVGSGSPSSVGLPPC